MSETVRTPRTEKPVYDPKIPVDLSTIKVDGCFGVEWDIAHSWCQGCAARDLCGMKVREKIDQKAAQQEQQLGSKFLDRSDFDFNEEELKEIEDFIISGETTSAQLVQKIMEVGQSSDNIAGIEQTKMYVKRTENVYIKDGIVCKRS